MKLLPTITGSRALGIPSIGSWLTCTPSLPGSYQSPVDAPNHVQIAGIAGVVPATFALTARAVAGSATNGTDAARKRGRPPRGNPR